MGSKTQEKWWQILHLIVNFHIFEKLFEICPIFKIYNQILLVIFYVTFSAHSWILVIIQKSKIQTFVIPYFFKWSPPLNVFLPYFPKPINDQYTNAQNITIVISSCDLK